MKALVTVNMSMVIALPEEEADHIKENWPFVIERLNSYDKFVIRFTPQGVELIDDGVDPCALFEDHAVVHCPAEDKPALDIGPGEVTLLDNGVDLR